jgi:hypothetical protein
LTPFAFALARPSVVRSMMRALELGGNPQHGKHQLGKVRSRVRISSPKAGDISPYGTLRRYGLIRPMSMFGAP